MERAGTEGNAALAVERLRLGYTTEEMAAYLGIDRNTYYTAEHYGREPGRKARQKIEERLGIPADKLFGELVYIRMCRACGNAFKTDNARGRLCPDCAEARMDKPVRRKRADMSVQQVAAQAREVGMSYGKYVAMKERGTL